MALLIEMKTSTYSVNEPDPRTPTPTTNHTVDYLNADPGDYVNESTPTR